MDGWIEWKETLAKGRGGLHHSFRPFRIFHRRTREGTIVGGIDAVYRKERHREWVGIDAVFSTSSFPPFFASLLSIELKLGTAVLLTKLNL
mmetsp:Transcript_41826/g.82604  ORF Transcript_41826/g.82604 Transcript_41826/m.82604 type:complete len:91 (+) Transcript_41826:64-336(+)